MPVFEIWICHIKADVLNLKMSFGTSEFSYLLKMIAVNNSDFFKKMLL